MKMKLKADPKVQKPERRAGVDRRQIDAGPPAKHERRRALEPRKPEVVELDMSNSEWAALNQDMADPADRQRS